MGVKNSPILPYRLTSFLASLLDKCAQTATPTPSPESPYLLNLHQQTLDLVILAARGFRAQVNVIEGVPFASPLQVLAEHSGKELLLSLLFGGELNVPHVQMFAASVAYPP